MKEPSVVAGVVILYSVADTEGGWKMGTVGRSDMMHVNVERESGRLKMMIRGCCSSAWQRLDLYLFGFNS